MDDRPVIDNKAFKRISISPIVYLYLLAAIAFGCGAASRMWLQMYQLETAIRHKVRRALTVQ